MQAGSWQCRLCGNMNFPHRDACNRCHTSRADCEAEPEGDAFGEEPAPAHSERQPRPVAGVNGNWGCNLCGNVNFANRTACNRCGAPREDAAPRQKGDPGAGKGSSHGGKGGKGGKAKLHLPPRPPAAPVNGKMPPPPPAPVQPSGGTWSCRSCGNVNFDMCTNCIRCQAPKPAPKRALPAARSGKGARLPAAFERNSAPDYVKAGKDGKDGKGLPVAGVDGNWECADCGNINFPGRRVCNRCKAPKEVIGKPVSGPKTDDFGGKHRGKGHKGSDANWVCSKCQNVNFPSRTQCNRCKIPRSEGEAEEGTQPFRKGDGKRKGDGSWVCDLCRNVNWPGRTACNRCAAPRPAHKARLRGKGKGRPKAGVDGNWRCKSCDNINFAKRTACNRCGGDRTECEDLEDVEEREGDAEEGDLEEGDLEEGDLVEGEGWDTELDLLAEADVDGSWECRHCANLNDATSMECTACGEPREEEELAEDANAEDCNAEEPDAEELDADEPDAKRARVG